jgi:hypothetical protein
MTLVSSIQPNTRAQSPTSTLTSLPSGRTMALDMLSEMALSYQLPSFPCAFTFLAVRFTAHSYMISIVPIPEQPLCSFLMQSLLHTINKFLEPPSASSSGPLL